MEEPNEVLTGKELVVKANDLIEGFTKMTQLEYKFTLYLISRIEGRYSKEKNGAIINEEEKKKFQIQTVKVKEFAEQIGYKGNSLHDYVIAFVKELATKTVNVRKFDEKNGFIYQSIPWFGYIKYEQSKGIVHVAFNEFMIPYLLDIDIPYTKYFLSNVKHMNSIYSIKIFELLKQYEKVGWRRFEIEELKNKLNINPKEYKKYNDFKKRVIVEAQKEINEKTDIRFEYKEEKTVRKITSIKFIINLNEKDKLENGETNISTESLDLGNYICDIKAEFKKLYNGELIYIESMIKKTSVEHIKECLKTFKEYLTGNVEDISKLFHSYVVYGHNWTKPTPYKKEPDYANFEQRKYKEEDFEMFYANLEDMNPEKMEVKEDK